MMIKTLLLALTALPACAQYTATLEPQPAATLRVLPARGLRLWTVAIVADVADAAPLERSRLIAATPLTEVTPEMTRDILTRDASRSPLTLLGKGFDGASPLIGPAMIGYGFSEDSKPVQWAGSAIAGLSLLRNLLRGQAPNPQPYLDRLLPESIPCRGHDCGTWYVLAGPSSDSQPIVVRIEAPEVLRTRLELIMRARREAGLLP